jgi:hypothetical protein
VASEAPVVRVPVDPVELETRLAAIERRLAEFDARERRLLELIQAVNRLAEAVTPLVKPAAPEPPRERRKPAWPLPAPRLDAPGQASSGPVAPERIAVAHARLRETLFAGPPAAEAAEETEAPESEPEAVSAAAPAPAEAAPLAVTMGVPPPLADPIDVPPPSRKSWLRRAFRHMAKHDPAAAGRLLEALLPAHALAQLSPSPELPGPPEKLAPLLVTGRVRRRIRWEKARLHCPPRAVSELIPLTRMRASVNELHGAGVALDPTLAFKLVASAIEPAWTAGHRFALAHRGPERVTYFEVRDRAGASVSEQRPSAPVATTVCCLDEALFAVLCGALPPGVSVLGAVAPLELVQRWFARASAR